MSYPVPAQMPARWVRAAAFRAAGAVTFALAAAVLLSLAVALSAEPATANSQWTAPVQPVTVISAFDPPAQRWRTGHRGVDLASTGTVRAAGNGTVTFVGQIAGRGVVSVSHGRLRTTYEPVDATVAVGQEVAAGQPIGAIGAGGHCSERCLHWGLLEGDEYLDPMSLLRMGPPVLKPLTGRLDPSSPRGTFSQRAEVGPEIRSQDGTTASRLRSPDGGGSQSQSSVSAGAALGGGLIVGGSIVGVAVRRARRRRAAVGLSRLR